MSIQYVIAIDPGLDGGIAILDNNNNLIDCIKMPTITTKVTTSKKVKGVLVNKVTRKRYLDVKSIVKFIKSVNTKLVCIESQRIASTDGYKSSLTTVTNYGIILGILYTLEFEVLEVAPTSWQIILKDVVDPLIPEKYKPTKRKSMLLANNKHDGIADAINIAKWYMNKHLKNNNE